jgi:hypothetical protein
MVYFFGIYVIYLIYQINGQSFLKIGDKLIDMYREISKKNTWYVMRRSSIEQIAYFDTPSIPIIRLTLSLKRKISHKSGRNIN